MRDINIQVNRETLNRLARDIRDYCSTQDNEMTLANNAVSNMLFNDWKGLDAVNFKLKWGEVNKTDSIAVKFRDSLKSYADSLDRCADIYKNTQVNIVNSAGLLMRHFGQG